MLHPDVVECIVLGVPDPDFGQAVAAVVVVGPESTVDETGLREHLAERLARYKTPSVWRITTAALPRNATGKVSRREVRLQEIGRASCRERVCQYVWVSVVAVALKKKKK